MSLRTHVLVTVPLALLALALCVCVMAGTLYAREADASYESAALSGGLLWAVLGAMSTAITSLAFYIRALGKKLGKVEHDRLMDSQELLTRATVALERFADFAAVCPGRKIKALEEAGIELVPRPHHATENTHV